MIVADEPVDFAALLDQVAAEVWAQVREAKKRIVSEFNQIS